MNKKEEVPVIFRKTKEGDVIALLPTIAVDGIDTTIVAYSDKYGFFNTDTGVIHNTTEEADNENIWPIISTLALKEKIQPLAVYKRIMGWMDEIRLDNRSRTLYRAVA